ncbi:MAG TPA: DUF72 domain-containing protein [Burkholderiaceae bacterium]|nr:DUF72 domain-containing protein [Burkholderiaceae bacterium]
MASGAIRVGIGGWNYEPWRTTFYPPGLPARRELEYASRQVTMIEINGTFYSTQKPSSFEKWRDETPDDFIFSVKAHRYTTNRKVLADAGESIDFFLGSGVTRLGPKLGPILWQLAPTKRFDPVDLDAFANLLPAQRDGLPLRHVLDVRHPSFETPAFIELLRRHGLAAVITDSPDYPSFANLTTDFVYLRLMQSASECTTGYAPEVLDSWAACSRAWAEGGEPQGVPRIEGDKGADQPQRRDVFMLMINGAKERAPAAAVEVLKRLKSRS